MATAAVSTPAPVPTTASSAIGSVGKDIHFTGREKQKDVRHFNITAAKAVADCIRTSLGPKGMDKMITSSSGDVVITNDGATILNKMEVLHPAARMLVDLSKAQDVEAGDGTTSVVVIAGAFLTAAQELLEKGIHPSIISEAWLVAQRQAEVILKSIAIEADLSAREGLVQSAVTSLNSKVVSANSQLLAPLAVDAVLRIIDPATAVNVRQQHTQRERVLSRTSCTSSLSLYSHVICCRRLLCCHSGRPVRHQDRQESRRHNRRH